MPISNTARLERAQILYEDAQAILTDENATAEQRASVDQMMAEADQLVADHQRTDEIRQRMSDLASMQTHQSPTGQRNNPQRGQGWADWGQFLAHIKQADLTGQPDPRLRRFADYATSEERKDLAEGVGSTGGYLVPNEFLTELYAAMAEDSIVRSRANVIRMRRRTLTVPVLDQTATTAGIPHWFGGMQAYWQEEASEKESSDAAFRNIQLTAHKLIMYTRASDELLDDAAISLSDFLAGPMGFAGAIAWNEDYSFLQGSGAGQPLGVINAPATIAVTRQTASNLEYADLATMVQNFKQTGTGVWLVSQSMLSELITLAGPDGNPAFIYPQLWTQGMRGMGLMLGYPVIVTEKVPLLGSTGDIGLYDFSQYLVGDRQATTVESTTFDRWRYDQTSWRAVHRVDGQPWLSTPLTLQDGTTQISPFVVLSSTSIS